MSYKGDFEKYKLDLKTAMSIEEVQAIYDKAIEKVAKKSAQKAVMEDYTFWIEAVDRVDELFPELRSEDGLGTTAGEKIISRY